MFFKVIKMSHIVNVSLPLFVIAKNKDFNNDSFIKDLQILLAKSFN